MNMLLLLTGMFLLKVTTVWADCSYNTSIAYVTYKQERDGELEQLLKNCTGQGCCDAYCFDHFGEKGNANYTVLGSGKPFCHFDKGSECSDKNKTVVHNYSYMKIVSGWYDGLFNCDSDDCCSRYCYSPEGGGNYTAFAKYDGSNKMCLEQIS